MINKWPKKLKQFDLIKVDWEDAHGDSGWNSIKDIEKRIDGGCSVTNIGLFLFRRRGWLALCSGHDKDYTDFGSVDFIPLGMIRKVTKR
jgi:hypothetical protein